jgi:hypothetical protein
MANGTITGSAEGSSINSAQPSSMASDQFTADLSTMDINARLPNFPIPRELRDMIYTYLLDGDYTRISRRSDQITEHNLKNNLTGPKAYHFHANILAVNREIHDETKELLYKKNTFLVVSYQRPCLGNQKGELVWVPIVSKKFVNRMTLHSLRIHTDPGLTTIKGALCSGTEMPIQSYIILARDIKAFAVGMHISEENAIGAGVIVVALPNMPLRVEVTGLGVNDVFFEPTRLKCQLRETPYRAMEGTLQNLLLAPFASIISISKKVSFTGEIRDPEQTAHLKQLMGPSLVCQDALHWALYKECVLAKELADATMEDDQLDFTIHLYSKIVYRLSARLDTLTNIDRDVYETAPLFAEILKVVEAFTAEVLITLAIGEVKLGRLDAFAATFRMLHLRLQLWGSSNVATGHSVGQSALLAPPLLDRFYSLTAYFYLYTSNPSRPEVTIGQFAEQLLYKGVEAGPYLIHDLQILGRHPNQGARMSPEHLPLDQCVAVCLPLTPTSLYKKAEAAMQSSHYKGWHNLDFIRSLSNAYRQHVRTLQASYGLEITDFSKL